MNVDLGYVHTLERFELCNGFLQGAKYLQDQGYALIVITNQAGIARSYYSEDDFIDFSHWIFGHLKQRDIFISSTYYCAHHPDFTGECACRKPKPRMILQALSDYSASPNDCLFIGDKTTDMMAAAAAKISRSHLIADKNLSPPYSRYSVGNWYQFIDSIK